MLKKTTLKIELTNPCDEAWEDMHVTAPYRRHCASCAKEVIDFSKMNDQQLVDFFSKSNGPVCGHFRESQLARELSIVHHHRSSWRKAAAVAAVLSLLGGSIYAQQSTTPIATEKITQTVANQPTPAPIPQIISGFVTDATTGELLIGSSIQIEGTSQGTVTDVDGYFELEVQLGQRFLNFSYMGYSSKKIPLDKGAQHLEVELQPGVELDAVVVIAYQERRMLGGSSGLVTISREESSNHQPIITPQELYLQSAEAFPNPSTVPPQIKVSSAEPHQLQIQLFNASGQLIWQNKQEIIAGSNLFPISADWVHWPSGTYFLSLEDENDQKKMLSLVKP
ncbi:MAG: carboxypeptidase-like regulatory domain-containing protein [Lewinella sp.]|jgi:hypothetical protein|uniref:carboxypeptidase-like regulatory domain-containing protein n=1 Tax=Lewinella sp. TaxID=2004506 RepID=UPI003D6C48E3